MTGCGFGAAFGRGRHLALWANDARIACPVIESILPSAVRVAEAFDDTLPAPLFAAEEPFIAAAVGERRREFATARRCARTALAALGHPPAPLVRDESGAPRWPAGVVGSITHCDAYRAVAVAAVDEFRTLGIDAEPHGPLPDGVLRKIGSPQELAALPTDRELHWGRLLFSAKEAVYKAWFPLTHRHIAFQDVYVTIDRDGRFEAAMLVGLPVEKFSGRWTCNGAMIATAITVDAITTRW